MSDTPQLKKICVSVWVGTHVSFVGQMNNLGRMHTFFRSDVHICRKDAHI